MVADKTDFIHRFVPAEDATSGRTLLLLHGTGGDESDLLPLGQMIAPGAALLSPRGRVLENGAPRFFRRLAEGVFDQEDLVHRTHQLADFIERAAARYGFDAGQVIAVGYSNGANIAISLMLLHPAVLSGAVLFRPMVPFVPEPLPGLTGVPVFVAAGRFDPIINSQITEQLVTLLRTAGAEVEMQWVAGGHNLTGEEVERAREWLASRR